VDLEESQPARRRRGAALEEALLEATWDELVEHGYGALTIDGVAQRAGTSRPVIYRRWPGRPELVRAAVIYALKRDPLPDPDTGTLRGDMVAVMRAANVRRVGVSALLIGYLGGYFQETGTSFADFREELVQHAPSLIDIIIDRAGERGEVDAASLTPRMRTVAFDLFRHEALMTFKPVPDDVIDAIVDEVFLPLVRARPG
jgi:AcrR family transcriptional regulator